MNVYIQLTSAGTETGPFNLYSDVDGYTIAFETGISKATLLAGYTSVLVPNSSSIIRIISTSDECPSQVNITISKIVCDLVVDIVSPTTTTSTTNNTTTTTTTTTIGCLEYIVNTDYIDELVVELRDISSEEAAQSSIGWGDSNIMNFDEPVGGVTTIDTSYLYSSSDVYTLSFCFDPAKCTALQFWDSYIYQQIMDVSIFTNLYTLIISQTATTNVAIEQVILPQVSYHGVISDGIYISLEGLSGITEVYIPDYIGTDNEIELYDCPNVTNIYFEGLWSGRKFYLNGFTSLGSIDLSGITLNDHSVYLSTSEIRMQSTGISSITLPSIILSTGLTVFIDDCNSLEYIDFSPIESDVLGVDKDITIWLNNNGFTSGNMNKMLFEINSYSITHTGAATIYISTGNSAPDNSSGGYDGLTAITNLQAKGFTVF